MSFIDYAMESSDPLTKSAYYISTRIRHDSPTPFSLYSAPTFTVPMINNNNIIITPSTVPNPRPIGRPKVIIFLLDRDQTPQQQQQQKPNKVILSFHIVAD